VEKTLPNEKQKQELIHSIKAFKKELQNTVEELSITPPILIAVSKKQPEWKIEIALKEGIKVFGENYVQEAMKKNILRKAEQIHLIGPLQKNKVKKAITFFHLIQAVDNEKILLEIEKKSKKLGINTSVLLEIKISSEPTKHGFPLEEAIKLAEKIRKQELILQNTKIMGIMGIASVAKEYQVAQEFENAVTCGKEIAHILKIKKPIFSLGMSNDYKIALAQGSNMIRIGTKIFGERE